MDYQFKAGSIPLLVSMPHVGTDIPDDVLAAMTPAAVDKQDTDWHLVRLYEFLSEMGASTLSARWSRYVIDLNRPPENTNLYPGQDTTGLCPVDTFHREPLYREGRRRTRPRCSAACRRTGSRITTSCARSWTACWRCTAAWCCGMRIPSPRMCRASLRASCRI
jgi:N-formylglutamate amidohydrolase